MSPSVPPFALQHEEMEQQQLPQLQQQQEVDSMIQRMRVTLNPSMQHPPVQHVDNYQDFLTLSHLNLELATDRSAGLSQASAIPTSFNQSAAINPTLTMSNGISMGHVSQSAASSMNPAANLPLSGNFNHGVSQLPAERLTNGLTQGVPREFRAMHPNAHIRRNQQHHQFAAHLRARRQVHGARLTNYGLHAQIYNLKTQLHERKQYIQLLENIIAELQSAAFLGMIPDATQ